MSHVSCFISIRADRLSVGREYRDDPADSQPAMISFARPIFFRRRCAVVAKVPQRASFPRCYRIFLRVLGRFTATTRMLGEKIA